MLRSGGRACYGILLLLQFCKPTKRRFNLMSACLINEDPKILESALQEAEKHVSSYGVGFMWWLDCFLEYTKEHVVGPLKLRTKAGKAEWEWLMAFMKTRPSGGGTYLAKGEDMPDPPAPITVDEFAADFERWRARRRKMAGQQVDGQSRTPNAQDGASIPVCWHASMPVCAIRSRANGLRVCPRRSEARSSWGVPYTWVYSRRAMNHTWA